MTTLIRNIRGSPYGNIWKLDLKLKRKIRFKGAFLKSFYLKNLNLLRKFVIVQLLNHVQLFETPWTVACQVPLSMEFSRQERWSGLPFSSPGDLLDPGIKPTSPALQVDSLLSEPPGKIWERNTSRLCIVILVN